MQAATETNIEETKKKEQDEKSLGIDAYLNTGEPFKGIMKYKFSDFIVNEIQYATKKVLFLDKHDAVSANQQALKGTQNEAQQQQKNQQQQQPVPVKRVSEQDIAELAQLIGTENAEKIQRFYDDFEAGDRNTQFYIQFPRPENVELRKNIHEFVRNRLPKFDSKTDSTNIVIFFTQNSEAKRVKRSRLVVSLIALKMGIDTNGACWKIANLLHLNPKQISSAGIKDKRGITTQELRIEGKFNDTELREKIRRANIRDMHMSNFRLVSDRLRVGDLYGNRFSLVIRLVSHADLETALQNFEGLRRDGFINYFGTQRFGVFTSFGTHRIGQLILQKRFKEAWEGILTYDKGNEFYEKLEEYKRTLEHEKILKALPRKMRLERSVIEGLRRNKQNNYRSAISYIPRNNRQLYLHAFQSYVWNKLATYRIQKYGKSIAIGDIVESKGAPQQQEPVVEQVDQKEVQEDHKSQDEEQDQGDDALSEAAYKGINSFVTEIITPANIAQYQLSDVLIPIIGSNITLPKDCNLHEALNDIMANELGLTASYQIHFREIGKDFFVEGGYRPLVGLAEDSSIKCVSFSDKQRDLVSPFYLEEEDFNEEGGKYKALIVRFSLQKGCYATMAIRELTKSPTSLDEQKDMNSVYESLP